MSNKFAISILVHRDPEIVADQSLNFHAFFPDTLLVFHVSQTAASDIADFQKALQGHDWAVINPVRMPTSWGDMLPPHLLNLKYIQEAHCSIESIGFGSSTDMLVRPGMGAYMSEHDAAYAYEGTVAPESTTPIVQAAFADTEFTALRHHCNATQVIWSQIEGAFYPVAFLSEFIKLVEAHCSLGSCSAKYYREEFLFSTLYHALKGAHAQIGYPCVLRGLFASIWADNKIHRYIRHPLLVKVLHKPFVWQAEQFWTRPMLNHLLRAEGKRWLMYQRVNGKRRFDLKAVYGIKKVKPELDDPVRRRLAELRSHC